MSSYSLRLAEPHELDTVAAIDEATLELFVAAGVHIDVNAHPEFYVEERETWRRSIARGLTHVACDERGTIVAFAALDEVDGEPYLEQVSVHPTWMRRGLGSVLLELAVAWSGARPLWLNTYAHLPWNKPFYERRGFSVVDEARLRPQMRTMLAAQRRALPHPEQRIVMVRRP